MPLRVWFKWMTRQNHILHNPASEIDLPRVGRTLPKNILSVQEIEQVMMQPNLADPLGLRTAPSWKRSMRVDCGGWKW